MPDLVDLVIEDARWAGHDLPALAERAARAALAAAGIAPGDFEISLLACDDARIATLNTEFRGKAGATNVLSWPAFDLFAQTDGGAPARDIPADPHGPTSLGDIAIAYDTVMAEAEQGAIAPADHISHLVLHACLHLLGYDHETDADATRMEELEAKTLVSMGLTAPY